MKQGFPKKTPVSQNSTIFLSDDKEDKKCKISTFNIFAIMRLLWETLYVMNKLLLVIKGSASLAFYPHFLC